MKKVPKIKKETLFGRDALVIYDLGEMSLYDTLECRQAFRYELLKRGELYRISDGYG